MFSFKDGSFGIGLLLVSFSNYFVASWTFLALKFSLRFKDVCLLGHPFLDHPDCRASFPNLIAQGSTPFGPSIN